MSASAPHVDMQACVDHAGRKIAPANRAACKYESADTTEDKVYIVYIVCIPQQNTAFANVAHDVGIDEPTYRGVLGGQNDPSKCARRRPIRYARDAARVGISTVPGPSGVSERIQSIDAVTHRTSAGRREHAATRINASKCNPIPYQLIGCENLPDCDRKGIVIGSGCIGGCIHQWRPSRPPRWPTPAPKPNQRAHVVVEVATGRDAPKRNSESVMCDGSEGDRGQKKSESAFKSDPTRREFFSELLRGRASFKCASTHE